MMSHFYSTTSSLTVLLTNIPMDFGKKRKRAYVLQYAEDTQKNWPQKSWEQCQI